MYLVNPLIHIEIIKKKSASNETLVKAVALTVPELELFRENFGKSNYGCGLEPHFACIVLDILTILSVLVIFLACI